LKFLGAGGAPFNARAYSQMKYHAIFENICEYTVIIIKNKYRQFIY